MSRECKGAGDNPAGDIQLLDSTVIDRITSDKTAETIVRSRASTKTDRQTTARTSHGY
jgi:hypothetical protein